MQNRGATLKSGGAPLEEVMKRGTLEGLEFGLRAGKRVGVGGILFFLAARGSMWRDSRRFC